MAQVCDNYNLDSNYAMFLIMGVIKQPCISMCQEFWEELRYSDTIVYKFGIIPKSSRAKHTCNLASSIVEFEMYQIYH